MCRATGQGRPLYWALLLSIALHGAALFLFPTIDAGARSLRVRLSAQGAGRGAGASGDVAAPRLLSTAAEVPAVPAPRQANRSLQPTNGRARTARAVDMPKRAPDSAPLAPELPGLDAGALRGLKVALASGLAGVSLPADAAGASTEAHLVFGDGGRLLAVSFSGQQSSRELEARLREALMKAAARINLPAGLRDARFELELAFELGDDGR